MATPNPPDPKRVMDLNLQFLRQYAKRVMVEGEDTPTALDDVTAELLEEVWNAAETFRLTPRDVVILLYKGILPESR